MSDGADDSIKQIYGGAIFANSFYRGTHAFGKGPPGIRDAASQGVFVFSVPSISSSRFGGRWVIGMDAALPAFRPF